MKIKDTINTLIDEYEYTLTVLENDISNFDNCTTMYDKGQYDMTKTILNDLYILLEIVEKEK